MESLQKRPGVAIVVGIIVGLAIGLLIGWYIWPVEWTDATPPYLSDTYQEVYLNLVADVFSHEGNIEKVQIALADWPDADATICQLAAGYTDPGQQARFNAIAAVLNGEGCTPAVLEEAPAEDEGGGLGTILFLFLLLIVLVVAIFYVLQRRRALMAMDGPTRPTYSDVPDEGPVSAAEGDVTAVPIARFRTTYTHGHDTYDDSFSIENAIGDFLGECGVGISESIGTSGGDSSKNVTAFEVWLFDKNDIRTITKVLMSDHAFFDEALKAKLATKGEQVLAREGETVVLETASLIINADVVDMEYGTGTLPPQSYFETVTFELSAWAKEGAAGGATAQPDDLLNY